MNCCPYRRSLSISGSCPWVRGEGWGDWQTVWDGICSDSGTILVCHGEKRADHKSEALDLLIDLRPYPHLSHRLRVWPKRDRATKRLWEVWESVLRLLRDLDPDKQKKINGRMGLTWVGCNSGGSVAHLLGGRFVFKFLVVPVCVPSFLGQNINSKLLWCIHWMDCVWMLDRKYASPLILWSNLYWQYLSYKYKWSVL